MGDSSMDMIAKGISEARSAGWSDADIYKYLYENKPELRSRFEEAAKNGYASSQVLDHLSGGGVRPDIPSGNENIDDETGAGWKERFIIGSAASDEDKLARARELYGNSVQQHGEDKRLSFIDPKTGRRTYVNPSGFDFGDVVGSGREIGSVAAGIIPAVFGTATTGIGGLAAGSAAGAAGGQIIDSLAAKWGRSLAEDRGNAAAPMQSMGDAAKEAGLETAGGIAGGYALGKLGGVARKAFNPMKREIIESIDRLNKQFPGLNFRLPTVASGTGSNTAKLYEDALGNTLAGGGIMSRARNAGIEKWDDALRLEAKRIAGTRDYPRSVEELGHKMKDAAADSLDDFRNWQSSFYDGLHQKYGGLPVGLSATDRAMRDIASQHNPNTASLTYWTKLNDLRDLLTNEAYDASNGNLTFSALKGARTRIDDKIKYRHGNTSTGPTTVNDGELRKIRAAMTEDMKSILTPDDLALYNGHLSQESAERGYREALDRRIFGNRSDALVGKNLTRPGSLQKGDVDNLGHVMSPEAMNSFKASHLRLSATPLSSAGEENLGGSSVSRFARLHRENPNGTDAEGAIPKDVRDALYTGTNERDLYRVADALDNSGVANTSKTARHNAAMSLIQGGILGGAFLGGGFNPAAIGLAAAKAVGLPAALAKATTSRHVIDYLSKPQSMLSKMMLGREGKMGMGATTAGMTVGREGGRRSGKKKDR